MSGLPVVIRLIDPPLHEFLPNLEDQLVKVTKAGDKATAKDKELLATIKSMHEQNPMLGLRGCRLGLMIPDFVKIQTRAILNAAVAVKKAGKDPRPEIMIPLVGHVNELIATQTLLEAEAAVGGQVRRGQDRLQVRHHDRDPAACWVADEIAKYAQFFSFGTNDLTQMTFGYSRDDAEGGFLLKYVEDKILPYNPFQSLDPVIVQEMDLAVKLGRKTRPDLKVGICGEHGGDPMSIGECHRIGLNYVSCSPFRVPVARLAAAQAALSAPRSATSNICLSATRTPGGSRRAPFCSWTRAPGSPHRPDDLGAESAGIVPLVRTYDVDLARRAGCLVAVFLDPLAEGAIGRANSLVAARVDGRGRQAPRDRRRDDPTGRFDGLVDRHADLHVELGLGSSALW